MEFNDIVSVSGMGGLFRVVGKRNDGLIVQSFDEDKPKFISNRIHVFTPLEGITIYTVEDSIELRKVFLLIQDKEEEVPLVSHKDEPKVIRDYFKKVLPEHDEEKVYVSDIKKILKWYEILKAKDLLSLLTPPEVSRTADVESKDENTQRIEDESSVEEVELLSAPEEGSDQKTEEIQETDTQSKPKGRKQQPKKDI